jgi:hypothetical protein
LEYNEWNKQQRIQKRDMQLVFKILHIDGKEYMELEMQSNRGAEILTTHVRSTRHIYI